MSDINKLNNIHKPPIPTIPDYQIYAPTTPPANQKEFIPTQIGIIYEENSLIGSVQDDSVLFDTIMTLFEFEPVEYKTDLVSKAALTLIPKRRPLSTSICVNRAS